MKNLLRACLFGVVLSLPVVPSSAQPDPILDLAVIDPADGLVRRVFGAGNDGRFGVPVAGGHDVDGDGEVDYAVALMLANASGRLFAGEVDLIFGDGTTGGEVDTAIDQPSVLRFLGTQVREHAGSEIWMDDVTGDGLGDLLICRQNYTPEAGRLGAGALTIVPGGAVLRQRAAELEPIDLAAPPSGVELTTLVGSQSLDRLCIWTRTGDVDGDGVVDIVVGADQEDLDGENNRGAGYVIRGGAHLVGAGEIEVAQTAGTVLAGHVAKITPPPGSSGFHLGATCQVADLDGNGRSEVLLAAALNRAGASLRANGAPAGSARATGGAPDGTLYIAWDDNFPAGPWPVDFSFDISQSPGTRTIINGEDANITFGEEILGGADYDADGTADLFVGDLVADGTTDQSRPSSGLGHVFFNAAALAGLEFDVEAPPEGLRISRILGPLNGAIGADTAAQGDFDGDGVDDLVFTSPHDAPQGRFNAGSVQLLFGRAGGWPELVDLAPGALPPASEIRVAEVQGARGGMSGDVGDTLGYSAAAGDVDGDGLMDLIVNEMVGNGVGPGAVDVGNLLVISGRNFANRCVPSDTVLCLNGDRFRVEVTWRDFEGMTGAGNGEELTDDTGTFWFFDPANVELVVKVLDGCFDPFDSFWVFAGGLTDVEVSLTVTDVLSGEVQTYSNALGTAFQPIRDVGAFSGCPAGARPSRPVAQRTKAPGCNGGATALCLTEERFEVEALWRTADSSGAAQAVSLTNDTGYFWFFDRDNVEVVIKVLDACEVSGFESFWIFAAGLTDVEVSLRVTDRVTSQVREFSKPLGSAFAPIRETRAFETCDASRGAN